MRTKLFLIMLLVSGSFYGQEDKAPGSDNSDDPKKTKKESDNSSEITTNVFKIDLNNPSPTSVSSSDGTKKRLSIKSRELLQFQVVGGNPLKYKYVLNNKLINFFEDKTDNPLAAIQKTFNQQPLSPEKTAEEIEATKEDVKDKIDTRLIFLESQKKKFLNSDVKKLQVVNDSIRLNVEKLEELKKYEMVAKKSFDLLKKNNLVTEEPDNIEKDKKNVINAARYISSEVEQLKGSISDFMMVKKSEENLTEDPFKEELKKYFDQFKTLVDDYNAIKSDATRFNDLGKEFPTLDTSIKQSMLDMHRNIKILYSIKFKNFTIPTDINGKNIDVVQVSLERFEDNNPIAIDKHTYNIWVRGGFKIDISGGVFLTSLVNREYYTSDVTVTEDGNEVQRKTIREREKGNFEFGFGSTINVSHRSASWINPTLNVGALFTVNQQFQLLTGLGAILGKEERIIFSGGLAMGRVTKISETFKADGTTPYDLGDGVVPTSSQFDFGYYFAITYNFSKSKKEKSE